MKKISAISSRLLNQIDTTDWIPILIIVCGLLIRIPLITHSADLWRESDTASIAHFFSVNGFKILYPQIFWGGNGPGYVESEFQLYPFIVSLLYYLFGENMWLGRLISFLFTTITTFTFYFFVAKKILKKREALFALIFLCLSPIFLRYGTAFMPEATMMCFYVAGLAFFLRWLDDRRFLYLILASLSISLAILVKPTAIHVGLILALLAVNRFGYRSLFKDWRVWFVIVLCLSPVVLYYLHAGNIYLEYGNTFGVLSGGDSKFGDFHFWLDPRFYSGLAQIEWRWVFGPLGAFIFVIGFIQSIKRRCYLLLFGIITIVIYYFIIPRYTGFSRGIQYHIYMTPFAALGFGIGLNALFKSRYRLVARALAWLSIIAVVVWAANTYKNMLQNGNEFTPCASQVKALVPADRLIIVSTSNYSYDQQSPSLPDNFQEPQIFYFSQRRGWSLPADWLSAGKFEEYRQKGAGYYIILNSDYYLINNDPAILNYVDANFNQINPSTQTTCRIYQFK